VWALARARARARASARIAGGFRLANFAPAESACVAPTEEEERRVAGTFHRAAAAVPRVSRNVVYGRRSRSEVESRSRKRSAAPAAGYIRQPFCPQRNSGRPPGSPKASRVITISFELALALERKEEKSSSSERRVVSVIRDCVVSRSMRASLEFREVAARRLLTYLSAGRQTLNNQRRFEFPGFLPFRWSLAVTVRPVSRRCQQS